MDTSKLKRFATEARNKIRRGVVNKLYTLGFDEKGEAAEFPVKLQGATLYRGEQLKADFYPKWIALHEAITRHGVKEVCEEAAYTWFNRFMAIRILQMNGFIDRALLFDEPTIRVPHIVSEARQGRLPEMSTDERLRLRAIIADPNKTFDQFALLITALCHTTPILNQCFGTINDYTELLLPVDILDEGGFIDMVNHTEFITEDDYKTTELLGWLYQFYIAERKDEVFASFKKGGKAEADDIPAATQIFTPNWIVKYMVENTVGRIYLDNNPGSSYAEKMPYLVEREEDSQENIYKYSQLEELKVLDPACGSGHILLEAFDLLYDLYLEDFYSRDEAITAIFRRNLLGIDIDNRARQLATFALLLKACQHDDSFLDGHCMPRVLSMPQVDRFTFKDMNGHFMCACHLTYPGQEVNDELVEAFTLMEQAENLGSIMKFKLSDAARHFIAEEVALYESQSATLSTFKPLIAGYRLILALTDKYAAVVANPPYMGASNMNAELSKYVKDNYPMGKSDLATVFVERMSTLSKNNGRYAFIIPPSWMFLSTFEGLRRNIIENQSIDSLLHLSRGVFGADFGASSAVIANTKNLEAKGTYFRLIERTFQEFDQKHLRMLFEKTLANHDFRYRFSNYNKDVEDIVYSEDGAKIYYPNVVQKNFEKVPGCPTGYWLGNGFYQLLTEKTLSQYSKPKAGLSTTDNNRFLRLWTEVSMSRIFFGGKSREDLKTFSEKWIPMTKGGTFRKWYGNNEYVLNFEDDGKELKHWLVNNPNDPTTKSYSRYIRNYDEYLKEGISFSDVACGNPHFRWQDTGYIPNSRGPYIYTTNKIVLGYANSIVAKMILELYCPTLTFNVGDIGKLPFKDIEDKKIEALTKDNITISRQDWDAHETSWDFQKNDLMTIDESNYLDIVNRYANVKHISIDPSAPKPGSLKWRLGMYELKWETLFRELHANEEELNREFIHIYGLEDELTPDVPMEEVTILQQGEIMVRPAPGSTTGKPYTIDWNEDVIIKQFISYAVGCMMGRYSIDKPGLILANQGDDAATYNKLVPNSRFEVDDDGIIPLMPEDSCFPDNATRRMAEFLKAAFGEDTQVENLNCIDAKLGKRLEDYFAKDFWKDHKKMYQNRPIYWLFQSKKGAFKVLVYMHRMDPYTVGKVRNKYLLPYIEWLKGKIDTMMARQAELSKEERKKLQNYGKQLDECREYDVRLHEVANKQIAIDLDDGVVVNYAKYGDILAKIK